MSATGKKQRTKGNVKPSSSARAAELLAASGYDIPNTVGFMGFDAIPVNSDFDGSTPSAGIDEPEDLDEDFRCSFRKAMKKDVVTKTKALREIASLIAERDVKIVTVAWQCWPRLYAKLALDGNFKVRELTHVALGAFAQKLGRQTANQLKNVVPYWLMGEHDPYQVAAQSAKQTFQDAFPAAKRPQVLAFCKESIITQCGQLVISFDDSAADKSGNSGGTEESSEARSTRLASCSLGALNILVTTINDDELSKAEDPLRQSLLSSPKFWKIVDKSKTASIRISWFNLITCLIRRCHNVLSDKANKLVPAIVNGLDENESAVAISAWKCLDSYLGSNGTEFWQNCNLRKAFLPKLVSFTRKACNGCASAIGQLITGVIRRLPKKDEDTGDIYGKILAAIHAGCIHILESKTSASETVAFVRIYCDYVRTICDDYATNPEFVVDFQVDADKALYVITNYIRSTSTSMVPEVFEHLADMVAYIINELPQREPRLNDSAIAYQSNLIRIITREFQEKASITSLSNFIITVENRLASIRIDCGSICRKSWQQYEDDGDVDYLRIIRNVFCGVKDISSLVMRFQNNNTELKAALDEFKSALLSRISILDDGNGSDQLGLVLDLCFVIVPVLDAGGKADLLRRLCQMQHPESQYQLLRKLREKERESVFEYVPETDFHNMFIRCFKWICAELSSGPASDEQRKCWRLFTDYLAGSSTHGAVVPLHIATTALEHLMELVEANSSKQNLSSVVALVAQLTSEIVVAHAGLLKERRVIDLVAQLFDLMCIHSDDLNDEALNLTKKACAAAVSTTIKTDPQIAITDGSVVMTLAKQLVTRVMGASLSRDRIEWLCSIAMDIISISAEALSNGGTENRMDFLEAIVADLLPMDDSTIRPSSNEWILNASINGRYPLIDITSTNVDVTKAADFVTVSRLGFVNLAAYGFLLCTHLNSSNRGLTLRTTRELHSAIAIRGLSTVAYIRHISDLFTTCGHHQQLTVLKPFGMWLTTLANGFWNSLFVDERTQAANTILVKVLTSGSLSTLALDFIRHHLHTKDIPAMNFNYEDKQIVAMLCMAPIWWNGSIPETPSVENVCGYLNVAASCDDLKKKLNSLDWLMSIKAEFLEEKLLFSCNIDGSNDHVVALNIALMRFFGGLVGGVSELNGEQRDFVLCATLTWLQSCLESDQSNYKAKLFTIFATKLFSRIAQYMDTNKDDPKTLAIYEEWAGFFLKGCVQIILPLFFKFARQDQSHYLDYYLLRELGEASRFATREDLMEMELPPLLAPELDRLGYPEKLQTVLLSFLPLLENASVSVQTAACSILEKFMDQLYEYEAKNVRESEDGDIRELPAYLADVIDRTYERIEHEFDTLHHVEDQPSFSAYLLTWKLLLQFFATIKTEDRPAYSTSLASSKVLDRLMLSLMIVLPENIALKSTKASADDSTSDFDQTLLRYSSAFEETELKSVIEASDLNRLFQEMPVYSKGTTRTGYVQRVGCHLLYEALRSFPAAIRQWYNNQEKKVANLIERFAVKYASPLLCSSELQTIMKSEKKYDNMTLMARPGAREVVACYKLEELTMELVVTLPQNYPLNAATVDVNHRVGVPVEQWRKWMLQLTVFLSHQNGGLLDGMLLWKRCIDKHLQGVEDCMICMMAVHGSNYQLPKITCKQCKKRFHAACLYKWFNTSSNTSCPMCRRPFQ